ADHCGPDHGVALVLEDLAAPVGELPNLPLEVVDGVAELSARGLHGLLDLCGGAGRLHQWRASSSMSRVSLASSIASSGAGGAPRLKKRTASRMARRPSTSRPPVTIA